MYVIGLLSVLIVETDFYSADKVQGVSFKLHNFWSKPWQKEWAWGWANLTNPNSTHILGKSSKDNWANKFIIFLTQTKSWQTC